MVNISYLEFYSFPLNLAPKNYNYKHKIRLCLDVCLLQKVLFKKIYALSFALRNSELLVRRRILLHESWRQRFLSMFDSLSI